MDVHANSVAMFLADEKFDFDVSLSPASSRGDEEEDEVFVDQVCYKERCASDNASSTHAEGAGSVRVSWSPLTGDELEAMCEEAHRLARCLQSSEPNQQHGDDNIAEVASCLISDSKQFVQETEAKLCVIGPPANVLSPVKCVQDSPKKQLPPNIQPHPQSRIAARPAASSGAPARPAASSGAPARPAASSGAPARPAASSGAPARPAASSGAPARPAASSGSSSRPAASSGSSSRPAASSGSSSRPAANTAASAHPTFTGRVSTSSPVGIAKAKPRTTLQGKAILDVIVVLPSKRTTPSTSCSSKKHKQLPQSKVATCWRPSPSRAGSYEDLLSDSASVASDISDSSLNSSLLGKCTLALPTKRVKNLSEVKAPPLQRKVTERKNTSSSSSSVSSFNSSLSLSPAKGKPNSSLNRSRSSSTVPAPSSVHKPANQNRQRRSNVYAATEPSSSTASCLLSNQTRKLSTPLKRAAATPNKRDLGRTTSIPTTTSAQLQSGLKAKPKPQALVPPTPSGGVKAAHAGDGNSSPDISKTLRPKSLMSISSVDGLHQKPSDGPPTPPASSCRSVQVKARRPSSLPTPIRSRLSTNTATTATNQASPASQPSTSNSGHSDATLARTASGCSSAPTDTQQVEPVETQDIQPFCLEEEPQTNLSATVPQLHFSESTDTGELSQGDSESGRNLIQLETTEEHNGKNQEVLLFDLPAPTLQFHEKLLIDLTHTPELIRTSNQTCTTTQELIDLTSPLIKWSPEEQKENDAPLINLSF